MRAVCGVRVDDQLRVRQVLLQDERVHRVNDDIIAAVHDQRRLLDSLQIAVRTVAWSGPLGDGRALCRRYLFVDFGIAILGAKPKALQEHAARRLACLRRREENAEPKVIWFLVGRCEDLVAFRRAASHPLAAARSGTQQYQAADELGFRKRYLLRHEAADREAQHVDLLEPQCLDECDGVASHLFDRGRNLARAARDAGVIEQNDFPLSREAIGHRRIPMVHRAGEVLVENQRDGGGCGGVVMIGSFVEALSMKREWVSFQPAVLPPSAVRICPVMNDDSSEARKMAARAISSASPMRPSGTVLPSAAFLSAVPVKRLSMPVSVGPGATALTRTPELAASSAADFVMPSTACLLAT